MWTNKHLFLKANLFLGYPSGISKQPLREIISVSLSEAHPNLCLCFSEKCLRAMWHHEFCRNESFTMRIESKFTLSRQVSE